MFGYDPINERVALNNAYRDNIPTWAKAERMDNNSDFMDLLFGVFSKKKNEKR